MTSPAVLVLDAGAREAILVLPRLVLRCTLMYLSLWTVLTLAFLIILLHGGKP